MHKVISLVRRLLIMNSCGSYGYICPIVRHTPMFPQLRHMAFYEVKVNSDLGSSCLATSYWTWDCAHFMFLHIWYLKNRNSIWICLEMLIFRSYWLKSSSFTVKQLIILTSEEVLALNMLGKLLPSQDLLNFFHITAVLTDEVRQLILGLQTGIKWTVSQESLCQ